MKKILSGNEAIKAYTEILTSSMVADMPKVAGYFTSDDAGELAEEYDKGTIVAFDNTTGNNYVEAFGNTEAAIDWINL